MRRLSDIVFRQHALTLPADASVGEACAKMRERGVGSALVVDKAGKLVGIFTGRDAVCRVLAAGKDAYIGTQGRKLPGNSQADAT